MVFVEYFRHGPVDEVRRDCIFHHVAVLCRDVNTHRAFEPYIDFGRDKRFKSESAAGGIQLLMGHLNVIFTLLDNKIIGCGKSFLGVELYGIGNNVGRSFHARVAQGNLSVFVPVESKSQVVEMFDAEDYI